MCLGLLVSLQWELGYLISSLNKFQYFDESVYRGSLSGTLFGKAN